MIEHVQKSFANPVSLILAIRSTGATPGPERVNDFGTPGVISLVSKRV
jgi:hypothetical protein